MTGAGSWAAHRIGTHGRKIASGHKGASLGTDDDHPHLLVLSQLATAFKKGPGQRQIDRVERGRAIKAQMCDTTLTPQPYGRICLRGVSDHVDPS
jgi:hypothetical protein